MGETFDLLDYCRAVPPGPEKGGIGVPSALLPAIWLFLNDCIVAPAKLTPVALPEIAAPPIRRVAAAPNAPVPKLFTPLVPVIVKLRAPVAMARTPSPSFVVRAEIVRFGRIDHKPAGIVATNRPQP